MTDTAFDDIEDGYPLTPLQQGMLFHVLSEPDCAQYVGRISAVIEGPVSEESARQAWGILVQRHTALRTGFLWMGLDQPMQVVHRTVDIAVDWANDTLEPAPAIDIAQPPLMRVQISPEGPEQVRLTWTIHHMIADGWSVAVVLKEFLALLNSEKLDPAPEFAAHADWLDTLDHAAEEGFWTAYFQDFVAVALPRSGTKSGFGSEDIILKPETLERLGTKARAKSVTLGTMIQSAFATALGAMTGQADVQFGLATSGRTSPIDGVADCVGLFVNTLPVRVHLSGDTALRDLEDTNLNLRAREHTPQALLARWSNTPPGQNLVEAVLSIRSLPKIAPAGRFRLRDFTARTPSNFPLSVDVDPHSGRVFALYDQSILSSDWVTAFLESLRKSCEGAPTSASANAALEGPPLAAPPVDILTRIVDAAAQTPDAVAVRDANGAVSYGALLQRAQAIAGYLQAKGVVAQDRVALVLPRTRDMVAAQIAVLFAGAAFVPIDASYPNDRINAILADCDPALVLRPEGIDDLPETAVPPVAVPASAAAYLIYTSGSTGTPKGVVISRRALATSQAARDQVYASDLGAFLLMSPFAFDSSIVGIYAALTSGGALLIAPERAEQDMAALGRLIAQHGVTHTLMLPSLYALLLDTAQTADLSSLQHVIVAGEACPRTLPARHAAILPGCALANEYGPTEATVWATVDTYDPGQGTTMTIGRPIPGMTLCLLANGETIATKDSSGEIALAGDSLATGYFNRPDATDQAFISLEINGATRRFYRTGDRGRLLPDGRVVYLGRSDAQVKIRGHRIETQDVEAAIASLDVVRSVDISVALVGAVAPQDLQAALDALPPEDAQSIFDTARGQT